MCYRMMDRRSGTTEKITESKLSAGDKAEKIESPTTAAEASDGGRAYSRLMQRLEHLLKKEERKEKESIF